MGAGLSLLEYPGVKAIDPAYALPVDVVNQIFVGRWVEQEKHDFLSKTLQDLTSTLSISLESHTYMCLNANLY